jgi:hypothetical protein
MGTFSTVIYDPGQPEIAKVNRVNKTLYLNPQIWKGLPADQKEFVLLHEKAHLVLQTADEFEANKYAVGQFAPVRTLTNAELGKRIVVMRNILTPRESGFDPISAIATAGAGAIESITSVLPVLGIGSASRIKETAANAAAQTAVITAQAKADAKKSNTTIIMVVLGGVLLIVMGSLYFILKK